MKVIEYNGKILLSPKYDLVFKHLFGKPDETLRAFLNDVLKLNIKRVEDICIENSEVVVDYMNQKHPRMDLMIKLEDRYINVEIQCSDKGNFEARSIFYRSKMVTSSLDKGQDYHQLKKCISLWILDYKLPQCDYVYDYSEDRLHYSKSVLSDYVETHIIQLPLFDWECELRGRNKWIGFLCMRDKIDVDRLKERDETMQEMMEKLNSVSAERKLQLQLQAEEDAVREYVSQTNAIERKA
ncbi:MAG: Rpn family recombination-promoting nuclease/putative transposase, partial [Erysipelotrichaceae bacterium]